ncbi:PorT family protein [Dyadobacter sp. CY345]|nr:PorT family protein [Dyadobacter sp. CY345]
MPITKMWFIQPEINYQNLGGGRDKTAIIPLQDYKKFTLQYVSIPMLVKFKIPQTGLALYAGPQYGFLFSKKLKTASDNFVGTDKLGKSDISAVIGTEYFFQLGGGNQIGLTGRYQFSLDNIDNFNDDELYIKNRVFSLTLAYRF